MLGAYPLPEEISPASFTVWSWVSFAAYSILAFMPTLITNSYLTAGSMDSKVGFILVAHLSEDFLYALVEIIEVSISGCLQKRY